MNTGLLGSFAQGACQKGFVFQAHCGHRAPQRGAGRPGKGEGGDGRVAAHQLHGRELRGVSAFPSIAPPKKTMSCIKEPPPKRLVDINHRLNGVLHRVPD